MAYQRLFESDKDFKARAKKEALEKSSGLSQGLFESDEAYEQRALRAALEITSGVSQGIFESDEAYRQRASKIALEKTSGRTQGIFESDAAYEERASQGALENISGVNRILFESQSSYQDRAMRSLADNPYGQRGYVYLTHEAKQTKTEETNVEYIHPIAPHSSSNSETSPILKGIGIGFLVDVGIFFLTLGGFLLDLIFGKQNYNFVLVIPPVIGGIIGAVSCSKK